MPLFEKTEEQRNYAETESVPNVSSKPSSNAFDDLIGIQTSVQAPSAAPTSNINSLVDLLGDTVPSMPTPSTVATNGLNDLIGGTLPVNGGNYTQPTPPPTSVPSITAWKNDEISVQFNFTRTDPILGINLIATNLTLSNTVTDFVFQAAVPKQLQIQISPASNNNLPPGGAIKQQMRVNNANNVALKMKVRIHYKLDGQPVNTDAIVSNFPLESWQ